MDNARPLFEETSPQRTPLFMCLKDGGPLYQGDAPMVFEDPEDAADAVDGAGEGVVAEIESATIVKKLRDAGITQIYYQPSGRLASYRSVERCLSTGPGLSLRGGPGPSFAATLRRLPLPAAGRLPRRRLPRRHRTQPRRILRLGRQLRKSRAFFSWSSLFLLAWGASYPSLGRRTPPPSSTHFAAGRGPSGLRLL